MYFPLLLGCWELAGSVLRLDTTYVRAQQNIQIRLCITCKVPRIKQISEKDGPKNEVKKEDIFAIDQ